MPEYKSTLREALEAEMLSDIGKLHDQVQDLKAILPAILQQIHVTLADIEARSKYPEKVVQRQFELYVNNQIAAIRGTTQQVKREVLNQLSADVLAAVTEGWSGARRQGDKLFAEATEQFNTALLASVEVAEGRATATMIGLCMDLKHEIDVLTINSTKHTRILTFLVSVVTGICVGIGSVFLLK